MYSKTIKVLKEKKNLIKGNWSQRGFFKIKLLKGAQMPQWAVQALRMREAGDTVKMLRKQTILWSGDDAPSGQQALKLFHNKTLSLGHIPQIEGYSTSN